MKALDRLRKRFDSSSTKEEVELTTDIQDKKPENLRTEETRYKPIKEA